MKEAKTVYEEALLYLCKIAGVNSPLKLIDKKLTITYHILGRYGLKEMCIFAKISQIAFFNEDKEDFLSIYFYPSMEKRVYAVYEEKGWGFVYEEAKMTHFRVKLNFKKYKQ